MEWDSTCHAQQFSGEETILLNRSILKRKKLQNHIAIYSVRYNTEKFSCLVTEAPTMGYKLHRYSFPGGTQGKILTVWTKAKRVKKICLLIFKVIKSHERGFLYLKFYLQTRGINLLSSHFGA